MDPYLFTLIPRDKGSMEKHKSFKEHPLPFDLPFYIQQDSFSPSA